MVLPAQAGMIPGFRTASSMRKVLPAQAGMILLRGPVADCHVRAPRASGDDPGPIYRSLVNDKCSPRKRG